MWSKKRGLFAIACVSVGMMLFIRGGLFLTTAYAASQADKGEVVGISLSQAKVFAGTKSVHNVAPGESQQGLLQIKNTGPKPVIIFIQNTLIGNIFADNGKTGTSLGTAVNPRDDNHLDGISIDYAANRHKQTDEFDDYPLQITYNVSVSGLRGNAMPIDVSWFSADNTSPGIQLPPEEIATVTYQYYMPWQAHNDYQGTTGMVNISVFAIGDKISSTSGNGGSSPNNPSTSSKGLSTSPSSPQTVTGATIPVTGLPFLSILSEGVALISLGLGFLRMSRKSEQ